MTLRLDLGHLTISDLLRMSRKHLEVDLLMRDMRPEAYKVWKFMGTKAIDVEWEGLELKSRSDAMWPMIEKTTVYYARFIYFLPTPPRVPRIKIYTMDQDYMALSAGQHLTIGRDESLIVVH